MSKAPTNAQHGNRISQAREFAGLTQAELAARAGISRAAVSSMETGTTSPSVHAAMAVARVLGCPVEDLFGPADAPAASGPQWAWPPHSKVVRYREAKVGHQRWIYPVEASSNHGLPHDGVWRAGEFCPRTNQAEQTLVLACCDPAAELLATEYARASGFRLIALSRSGAAALDLLSRGQVHVAGLHRATGEQPDLNVETVRHKLGQGYCLVRAAGWQAGLAVRATERARSAQALLRKPRRWALREPGSVAREFLDQLSPPRHLTGQVVSSHRAVAEAVRTGWADAGVCVEMVADEAGLNFIPLRWEWLDFCFPVAFGRDPRLSALVRLLRSRAHRTLIGELPGYDVRQTGQMLQT